MNDVHRRPFALRAEAIQNSVPVGAQNTGGELCASTHFPDESSKLRQAGLNAQNPGKSFAQCAAATQGVAQTLEN
jgi:hypothetical protein